jgi:hypothetical protein
MKEFNLPRRFEINSLKWEKLIIKFYDFKTGSKLNDLSNLEIGLLRMALNNSVVFSALKAFRNIIIS